MYRRDLVSSLSLKERFSFAGGRGNMCKSVGLKDGSGCRNILKDAGWEKGSRDDAIDLLCDAELLSNVDCTYFQAGGETPEEDTGLTTVWISLFVLLALTLGAWFLIKKFRKKKVQIVQS